MLQDAKENPHATLITLFMNATHEVNAQRSTAQTQALMIQYTRRVMQYMTINPLSMRSMYSASTIKMMMAQELVHNLAFLTRQQKVARYLHAQKVIHRHKSHVSKTYLLPTAKRHPGRNSRKYPSPVSIGV